MRIFRVPALIAASFILTTLTGCAKFPTGPTVTGKQLVITLRVTGKISPVDDLDPGIRRYYFIAIDNDDDANTGPWAVVFPPFGGNGWVTSQNANQSIGMTSFIEYDAQNPEGFIYGVLPGSFFLNMTSPQPPIDYQILDAGSTLRFVIDFNQIATAAIPVDQIKQLDINFITTNELAIDPNGTYPDRRWDALGPSGQNYVSIDTTTDRTYSGNNEDGPPVVDPDLDIDFWSIEIQSVSSR